LAVSIDQGSPEKVSKKLKDYVKKHNLSFLNLLDPASEYFARYGMRGIPVNFFINTHGKVVALAQGYREWKSAEGRKVIEQLLSETN